GVRPGRDRRAGRQPPSPRRVLPPVGRAAVELPALGRVHGPGGAPRVGPQRDRGRAGARARPRLRRSRPSRGGDPLTVDLESGPLERVVRRAPLALRLADPATGEPVHDGVVITVWPADDPTEAKAQVTTTVSAKGVGGFHRLPGLARYEDGSTDRDDW